MPSRKGTRLKHKQGYSKNEARVIRDPFDNQYVLYFVGFQEGELVWIGHSIMTAGEDFVNLQSAKVWPNMRKVSYSLEKLKKGVVLSDELTMALDLQTAIDLRLALAKRKKDRADKAYNAVSMLNRAVAEADQVTLLGMVATEK